jgi:hypothetical protein
MLLQRIRAGNLEAGFGKKRQAFVLNRGGGLAYPVFPAERERRIAIRKENVPAAASHNPSLFPAASANPPAKKKVERKAPPLTSIARICSRAGVRGPG